MSLMHFLSVSRSFENVEDRPGNYKLGTEGSLPKFESTRPAVSLPTTRKPVSAEPATARQGSLFSELVARPALEKKEISSVSVTSQKTVAPASQAPVAKAAPVKPAAQPLAGPLFERRPKDNKWKTMIKELFFGRRRRRSSDSIYQAELALENVTVVRNDLRDADIEVVSAPKMDPTPFAAAPTSATTKVVPPHKNARDWVKLTAGLIRPRKTEFYPSQGVASAAEQNRTPDLIARR